MESEKFNPAWLIVARQSRGITQKDLADSLSVNQGWLSRIESGLRTIPDEKIEEVAKALGYPLDFFNQPNPPYLAAMTDVFHRKIAVPEKTLDKINGQLTVVATRLEQLLQGVEIAGDNIKTIDLDEFSGTIEDVADMARANFGIPSGAISNVTRLIEHANGIVIPFDFGTRRIDATCFCITKARPLFFMNVMAPGDRLRFTLCHELGHLIMHQGTLREHREEEANRFAAQFLMPSYQISPYMGNMSLSKLATLKIQWKVSMAALLKRAQTLNFVTPNEARRLWIQMSPYKQREPEELDIPVEVPHLFREIVEVYQNELGYDVNELSKILHLNENDTYRYFFEPSTQELAKAAVEEAERLIKGNQ